MGVPVDTALSISLTFFALAAIQALAPLFYLVELRSHYAFTVGGPAAVAVGWFLVWLRDRGRRRGPS